MIVKILEHGSEKEKKTKEEKQICLYPAEAEHRAKRMKQSRAERERERDLSDQRLLLPTSATLGFRHAWSVFFSLRVWGFIEGGKLNLRGTIHLSEKPNS